MASVAELVAEELSGAATELARRALDEEPAPTAREAGQLASRTFGSQPELEVDITLTQHQETDSRSATLAGVLKADLNTQSTLRSNAPKIKPIVCREREREKEKREVDL